MRRLATRTIAFVILSPAACGERAIADADGSGHESSGEGDTGEPPSTETPWTLAVAREPGSRIWLVGADGSAPQPIPVDPNDPPDHQHYVGWTADGEGLYLDFDSELQFFTDDRLEPVMCPDFGMWAGSLGCVSHLDVTFVLTSGAIVIARNFGSGHIPGSNPTPEAFVALIDHGGGQAQIIAQTNDYPCISIGDGPVIVATEEHVRWVDEEPKPHYERSYVAVVIRGGERQVVNTNPPLGVCAVVTKAGDRIAWPHGDGTKVTNIEDDELASTPYERPLAWSADGHWLAGIGDDDLLWLLDVEDGTTETLQRAEASALHWAPTASLLAVELRCPGSGREIRILDGGTQLRAVSCGEQLFGAWAPDGRTFAMSVREADVEGFRILATQGSSTGPFVDGRPLAFRPGRR